VKIFETPKATRVRPDFGVPASLGAFGADRGIDVQTAAQATLGAGFRRTAAHAAGMATAPLRAWSPPIT
jgi:hypothetical protein